MKTAIIYAKSQNCTEKAVHELSARLSGDIELIDLKLQSPPSLNQFDRIIIGSSLRSGKVQKEIHNFCLKNLDALQSKEVGLFVCSFNKPEIAHGEMLNAYPEELHQLAKTEAIFKTELNPGRLSLIKKMLIKQLPRVVQNDLKIDDQSIDRFAWKMERTYSPFMFLV
jgi:menaquinone-dependent protoporphyrinogen oxidase